MTKKTHPFVQEAAEEARKGGISRRDFFKYAACFGVSAVSAGMMLGLTPPEIASAAKWTGKGWRRKARSKSKTC